MKIPVRRMQPPVASPIDSLSLVHGFLGLFRANHYGNLLDEELRAYFGVRYVFKVSSGKAALALILQALAKLAPDRCEVIIPAYTCFSVPSAVVKAGLTPAPCDMNPSTFDYDLGLLSRSIGERTLCVVSCHLFGMAANVQAVRAMCSKRGVFVVEDAAQAMGVVIDGTKLGTQGDVGFFSLGRGKNITCGSGGIILTNSDSMAVQLTDQYRSLASSGFFENIRAYLQVLLQKLFVHPLLFWLPAGIPQLRIGETLFFEDFPMKKLSGMAAGLLSNWRERLDRANAGRRETARFFAEQLGVQTDRKDFIPYLRFPFLTASREQKESLMSLPESRGLGLSPMYPTGVDAIYQLKDILQGKTYPVARDMAERLVTLPTHYLLSHKDKVSICKLIKIVLADARRSMPDKDNKCASSVGVLIGWNQKK